MSTSVYSRELDAALLQADRLGHKLSRVSVHKCVARAACERCGNSLVVMFHTPVVVMGTAVDKECGHGEKNAAPDVPPTPPTGEAKELRTWSTPKLGKPVTLRVPSTPVMFDDVPFPTDADCLVRR